MAARKSGGSASGGISLHIDLAFSLFEPGKTQESDEQMQGTITADGKEVEIYTSDPALLAQGRSMELGQVRGIADELAKRGLTVTLTGPGGLIARIGDVDAPLLQRIVTKSPHISLGSASALAPLFIGRNRATAKPVAVPMPPPTLFPLVPTLDRKNRRRVTTTHYTPGGGRPRLIFVVGSENWNGQMPREFNLLPTTTTIGSGAEVSLQLEGLKPLHAEIRHDANDEYVLYPLGDYSGSVRESEDPNRGRGQILRTGARIEMGPWRMAYFREEFADHGRPFGGRAGGEYAVQKPQPPRRTS
ncbi:MAG: FHA domain-containing protein [Cryobacterium sp.]